MPLILRLILSILAAPVGGRIAGGLAGKFGQSAIAQGVRAGAAGLAANPIAQKLGRGALSARAHLPGIAQRAIPATSAQLGQRATNLGRDALINVGAGLAGTAGFLAPDLLTGEGASQNVDAIDQLQFQPPPNSTNQSQVLQALTQDAELRRILEDIGVDPEDVIGQLAGNQRLV